MTILYNAQPCDFFVTGYPRPKGSLRANPIPKRGGGWLTDATGRPVVGVRHDSEGLIEWQDRVAREARVAWTYGRSIGAIGMQLCFVLPRPLNEWSTKAKGLVKPSAIFYPTKKPDVDKLTRAILDAFTGTVYVDDAQVTDVHAWKRYQDNREEAPGVAVSIWAICAQTVVP